MITQLSMIEKLPNLLFSVYSAMDSVKKQNKKIIEQFIGTKL